MGTVVYLYEGSQVRVYRPLVGFLYLFYEDPTSHLHVGTVVYLYEGQVRVHRPLLGFVYGTKYSIP